MFLIHPVQIEKELKIRNKCIERYMCIFQSSRQTNSQPVGPLLSSSQESVIATIELCSESQKEILRKTKREKSKRKTPTFS